MDHRARQSTTQVLAASIAGFAMHSSNVCGYPLFGFTRRSILSGRWFSFSIRLLLHQGRS
jgi:alpha-glucosidase (family GH31 glycosyl hydrolase)